MKGEIESLVLAMKDRAALPKKIEITKVADYCFVNSYDELNSQTISESVACGFDKNPDTALAKSLSEFYEGKAFKEGHSKNLPSCRTDRSDGFAAFPNSNIEARLTARKSAMLEAIERYVWATWWDDSTVGFDMRSLDPAELTQSLRRFVEELFSKYQLKNLVLVEPHFEKVASERLFILIGFLPTGGVVSGGACGEDHSTTLERALSELFRHILAIKRFGKNGVMAASFYERRLAHFATPEGQSAVSARLKSGGGKKVKLPDAMIDEEVAHTHADLIYVHRFLFKDQPQFIGGDLDRFCI